MFKLLYSTKVKETYDFKTQKGKDVSPSTDFTIEYLINEESKSAKVRMIFPNSVSEGICTAEELGIPFKPSILFPIAEVRSKIKRAESAEISMLESVEQLKKEIENDPLIMALKELNIVLGKIR